ncbi:hypothetical protein AB0I54_10400 [Streptomyces sp. NPDC050625]|uniref:hypothetical protein n=1 Tax=Streptomyces sp. NPDC050625 TaxID=3154629 RepID=UPI00341C11C5
MRPRIWVLVLAAVFAVLQLANVTGRDTPDSRNYVSYALNLTGESKRAAASATVDWVCAGRASLARRNQSVNVVRFHGPSPTRRVVAQCEADQLGLVDRRLRAGQTDGHIAPFNAPRLKRIFEVRPGYPLFLVPFVTVFGVTWGVWLASVLVTAAGGVLAFLILRTLAVPLPLALSGQALYYVLPCGTTAMRPMAEGLMLALTLGAVWGCALALNRRPRAGTALVAGCLLALFAVKHSQSLFLGLCLGAAATAVAVRRRWRGRAVGRGIVVIAVAGWCAALGTVLLARLLHYPSESDSLQDLLTDHYRRPDRAHPWPEFLHLESSFWIEWVRRQFMAPLLLTTLAAGAWGALRRPAFGCFLLAAAFTGILTQAAHPDITVWGERLIVLAWLLPVLGMPLLLEPLTHHRPTLPAQGKSERQVHPVG